MSSSWGIADIVSSLKEKSQSAMETLSHDLQEFTTVLREDIAEVAQQIDTSFSGTERATTEESTAEEKEEVTKEEEEVTKENSSSSSFNDSSNVDDDDEQGSLQESLFSFGNKLESLGSQFIQTAGDFIAGHGNVMKESEKTEVKGPPRGSKLMAIQEDPMTYLSVPDDFETFTNWKSKQNLVSRKQLEETTLNSDITVSKMYTDLVPSSIDHDSFWNHYFYKVSLLQAEENLRSLLFESRDDEESIEWDADEDDHLVETTSLNVQEASEEENPSSSIVESPPPSQLQPPRSEDSWVDIEDKAELDPAIKLNVASESVEDDGDDDKWDDEVDSKVVEKQVQPGSSQDDNWGDWD